MISFQHPEYWLAALAVLIPLIIHLLNQGIKQEVDFGSLAWLNKEDKSVHTKFKFQNALQWLLRTFLFLILLFMLLNPFWKENVVIDQQHLVVIDKQISESRIINCLDTLNQDKTKIVFNDYALTGVEIPIKQADKLIANIKANEVLNLLNIEKSQPKSLSFIGKKDFFNFEQDTINSNFQITFHLVDENNQNSNVLGTINKNGELSALSLDQTDYLNRIKKQSIISADNNNETLDLSSRDILVIYNESSIAQKNQLLAAFQSLEKYLNVVLIANNKLAKDISDEDDAEYIFNLTESLNYSFTGKQFIQNKNLNLKHIEHLSDNTFLFNINGSRKNEQLPYFLATILFQDEVINQKIKNTLAKTKLPFIQLEKENNPEENIVAHSMMLPLSMLLLLIFFAERFLNYKLSND